MIKIGFVTSEEDPELIDDDKLVIEPLKRLGISVSPIVWDQNPSLAGLDALIFRSCWNYHRKTQDFLNWLDSLKSLRIRTFNPIDIGKWNINKGYLLELEKQGIPMPKTKLIKKGSLFDSSLVHDLDVKMVVIKPAISLNGQDTYIASRDDDKFIHARVTELLFSRDVIIQEYMPEIKSSGEFSFIFFDNTFSHAIQKLPAENEFRIHAEYGGSRRSFIPDSSLIQQAKSIIECTGLKLLYCRVDAILRDGKLYLIELEIIDPMLFLGYSEGAPKRFADAIFKAL